jgi:hypothetical protein
MLAVTAPADVDARPRRFTGLLPHRLLRWRRPLWWQEIAIIAVGYALYSAGRNAIPERVLAATEHGRDIQTWQDAVDLSWERGFNHFVAVHEWLAQPLDYYYATLHFIITPAVLGWMFLRRSHVYRGVRTVLVSTSVVALLCYYVYPVAPPRLVPGLDYIDTVVRFDTWGSLADPQIAERSNQYAAMPSLHIAWAMWCGIAMWVLAERRWLRVAALLYPMCTLVVIVGTGNHFVLDAAGGALVLAVGFGIQLLLSGHGAFVAPVDAPDFGQPDPPLPHLPGHHD